MTKFNEFFEKSVENYLHKLPDSSLKKAMSYALSGTGKRLRPQLMLSLIASRGLSPESFYSLALALECVHTYSLVHDDLPAMDDDSMRRGKPTVHIAFDEATAILAGDALLTDAFSLISEHTSLSSDQKVQLITTLSNAIGSRGMVLGQVLDIASEGEKVSLSELEEMNQLKTGKLLEASILFGAIVASETSFEDYKRLAYHLGLLYQLQDDLLETLEEATVLGKSKSDLVRNKPTTVTHLGLEKAQELEKDYHEKIRKSLIKLHLDHTLFSTLIETIIQRSY
jgi:geranylgeranyl diphosphate synthase type II